MTRPALRDYPLGWRLLDACEWLLRRLAPPRFGAATPYLLLIPAVVVVGVIGIGLVHIGDSSLRALDRSTFLLSDSYSLDNYRTIAERAVYLRITWRSIVAAVIVTSATLVLGFPYAYAMVRTPSSALRKVLLVCLFLPFFIGQVVRAYGWLIILGKQGLINQAFAVLGLGPFALIYNYGAVIVGLIQYMLPFAVLLLAPALTAIDADVERASESLGATWISTFRHVVLPMARPGLVAAGLVVFTITLTDFAMPEILGGGTTDFAANAIYDGFFAISDAGLGSALSIVLVAIGSAVVAVVFWGLGAGTLGFQARKDV